MSITSWSRPAWSPGRLDEAGIIAGFAHRDSSAYYEADAKRVYYLSLEFLMGRALLNNVVSLGARHAHVQGLRQLGYDLEAIQEEETWLSRRGESWKSPRNMAATTASDAPTCP